MAISAAIPIGTIGILVLLILPWFLRLVLLLAIHVECYDADYQHSEYYHIQEPGYYALVVLLVLDFIIVIFLLCFLLAAVVPVSLYVAVACLAFLVLIAVVAQALVSIVTQLIGSTIAIGTASVVVVHFSGWALRVLGT